MPVYFKTPEQCPELEVLADMEAVVADHVRFDPIAEYGLKIDVIIAFADDDGPALTKAGAHPEGYIKVGNKEARAEGRGDVKIFVDGGKYRYKSQKERAAFWAHELYHISIKTHKETTLDDDGKEILVTAADLDDYGRPVVKLIPDDWTVTGFREVAEWYGDDSGEVKSHRAIGELLKQALMPFMAGDDRAPGTTTTVNMTGAKLGKLAKAIGKP